MSAMAAMQRLICLLKETKMTRSVIFADEIELIKRDKFGTNCSEWQKFTAGTHNLDILDKDFYYQSRENERFFIYDGVGDLKLSECTKKYDFEKINVIFLSHYIANDEHHADADAVDKALIEDYAELYDKFVKGDESINPPYFKELEQKLVNGL
jgi:hypothetical protein